MLNSQVAASQFKSAGLWPLAVCICLLPLALLLGCSPKVERVRLLPVQLPPKPVDFPIQLYSDKDPECPFEEIGLVVSRKRNAFVSMEEVTESLRAEARKMGGDAVIKVKLGSVVTGGSVGTYGDFSSVDVEQKSTISGTVIRWLEANCSK